MYNLQQDLKQQLRDEIVHWLLVLLIYISTVIMLWRLLRVMHTTMSKKEFHDKTEKRGSLRLDHNCSARPLKGVCVRTIWYAWEHRSEKRLFDVLLDDWQWKGLFASMEHDERNWLFSHRCMVGYRVISYERCWDIRRRVDLFFWIRSLSDWDRSSASIYCILDSKYCT